MNGPVCRRTLPALFYSLVTVYHCRTPFLFAAAFLSLAATPAQGAVGATNALPASPELEPISWVAFGSSQVGFGFRDNVLLSHSGEERSSFVRGGVDATAWRVPQGRVDYLAVVSAAGTRYFSAKTVNQESQAIVLSEWRYRIGDTFRFSVDGRGYYFDQIYDSSDSELQQLVTEVKTSGASVGPKVRWSPQPWGWIEGQANGKREIYPDGINNRSVRDVTLRLGWKPGKRVEASVAGTEVRRGYDRREQVSVSGRQLLGTVLRIAESEVEARLNVALGSAGQWKTVTRAALLRFSDNGEGYLDYRRSKLAQELEWTGGDWLVAVEGSVRRIEFAVQTVGFGIAPPPRIRDDVALSVRIERQLSTRWTAYAEYLWERNRSNDPLASYSMNEGLLGLRWNWEK